MTALVYTGLVLNVVTVILLGVLIFLMRQKKEAQLEDSVVKRDGERAQDRSEEFSRLLGRAEETLRLLQETLETDGKKLRGEMKEARELSGRLDAALKTGGKLAVQLKILDDIDPGRRKRGEPIAQQKIKGEDELEVAFKPLPEEKTK
ncbi:MAG: hypothetical protein EA357_01220 [Micavibrio sp.]|nr:MAG: hypothetical protein EA357_01220 [Micavibrio sp.]